MTKKSIKVVNPKRFVIFLVIVTILLIVLVTFTIKGIFSTVKGNSPKIISYETVIVSEGEDLWSICSVYCPEQMDIREFIFHIEKSNNISGYIYPGMVLSMPIYGS